MSVKEKLDQLLPLFEQLTTLTREQLPPDQRDARLIGVGVLPRGTLFSCFHTKHLQEATKLFLALYSAADFADFLALAKQAREVVNEGLFVYALSVAVAHRDDCKGVTLPPIQEVFPDRFIPAETINLATKEAKNKPTEDIVVEIEDTGNILEPEYKLAYFREDVGINAHHWYWHVVYPAYWDSAVTGKVKDRKGELFYYMHQQMCARYDCERLSNGLQRMVPFHNFEERLEGYAPHLTSLVSGLHYASRPQGFSLRDLTDVDVQDMERWRERILEAIDLQHVHGEDGKEIALDEANGANILGSIIEASSDSPNKGFYGSLHNWGHVMMARMHDPDGRFQENPGVMSDTSTALRDPIFYRWHRFVDNLFQEYKLTLKTYTKEDLTFAGVKVVSAEIQAKQNNVVTTFMKDDLLDLSHGINFGTGKKVSVKYHHLDHEPFSININVDNTTGAPKHATIRVFLGPKFDELGNRLVPDEQRRLFIELDKFHKELAPGKNTLSRNAIESAVTLAHTFTFDELQAGKGSQNASEYCSCGWPENMLIPRGTHKGMDFELFVMLTDYTVDNPEGAANKTICNDAVSYCGAKDQKYPDKKPMGFPFDRPIHARTAAEFLTENMILQDVKIKFLG
ncbi:hemocyanin G chain-like [Uloborus diversus]|uniref:hemocyanin G chain-like n=1 Tax=Uloborus diversus TaxID=327109 RepID=UPI00240A8634|nr:hemocyanin G chain-like [Uloborus diversus]